MKREAQAGDELSPLSPAFVVRLPALHHEVEARTNRELLPALVSTQQNFFAISALVEGLTGYNPKDARPEPALAEWLAR